MHVARRVRAGRLELRNFVVETREGHDALDIRARGRASNEREVRRVIGQGQEHDG